MVGYIWQLQDEGVAYTIKWATIAKARAFTASSKKCLLCLMEKVKIMHTAPAQAATGPQGPWW